MPRKWSNTETMLLLRLYMKYKQDFHERHKKRSEVWLHIVREFEQHGFKATYIKLDRKFRNMSRTYFNIKRQQKGNDPNWEYFAAMDEIYSGTRPISATSSDYEEPESEAQAAESNPYMEEPVTNPIVLLDEPNFDELMSICVKQEQNGGATSEQPPFVEALEMQRLNELQAIRITMQEANEIQRQRNILLQERNELMRRFLASNPQRNLHLYNLVN